MRFRKNMKLAMVSVAMVIALTLITQSRANGKQTTLTGVVTDSMCGGKHMMSGDDAKCVRTCVKGGSQYALLVRDKVYPMKGKQVELDRLAGQSVTVTGDLTDSVLNVSSVIPAASSSAPARPAAAADQTPPATTIEGLVRDIACPIQNKQATATDFNLKCAQECARLGSPLIVLTQDGVLYTPISEAMPDQDQRQRLMPFLGKYVRVTGPVFERNGTRAIAIRTIEEVKGVPLKTDAE
jgi:hypothetical protein